MTSRKVYGKIVTYEQAFGLILGIDFDEKIREFVTGLEKEGHTEKSIAFAIWRTKDILLNHVKEDYFLSMLKNEILRYSWTKDDARWKEYNENKGTEERINEFVNNSERLEFIYFIQGESGGSVRFGCSLNPVFTLRAFQKGYPDRLKILLVIREDFDFTKELKTKFKKHKLKGDWYKPDKEIFDEIENLKKKYPHVVGD